jgi:hypothetical protein
MPTVAAPGIRYVSSALKPVDGARIHAVAIGWLIGALPHRHKFEDWPL